MLCNIHTVLPQAPGILPSTLRISTRSLQRLYKKGTVAQKESSNMSKATYLIKDGAYNLVEWLLNVFDLLPRVRIAFTS